MSIGFKNPFHDSGYTNAIKLNNLDNINVFIGKNNSGKSNVLRSIFNLLHQDINRGGIFRRLKIQLTGQEFESVIKEYHKTILNMYQRRNVPENEIVQYGRFYDGEFVNQFYPLFNSIKDYPLPDNVYFIFNYYHEFNLFFHLKRAKILLFNK